ncbi:MAG: 2TM domain-containing protein [Flavobacteriales bacterium]|nr:2TM domain-containing protein [Flavobacteriales bacterium]
MDNEEINRQYIRAKKRVKKLKSYYSHLMVYTVVNTCISVLKITHDIKDGDSIQEALFDGDNYSLWLWWGIGIVFHTYQMFGSRLLFLNKDWEDRKIKEYMNEK